MAEIKFKTAWLTAIGLAAKCGTPDEVMDICVAIQKASLGEEVGELTPLVELLFNPIAEDIEADRTLSRVRSEARKGNKSGTKSDKTATKINKEKEEEREEEGEAERETAKEKFPHTPLKEKDKEKGEEGEEEKEEEREISCAIALPTPQFVAETDTKKLTDSVLEDEFDALWLLYPRKAGKSDALRHYKAARRKGVTYDAVEDGIKRYADYVQGQDPQYIAMGSTWFNGHRWEDIYIRREPKAGSLEWLASIARGDSG